MVKLNLKWLAVGVLVLGSVAAMAQDGGGRRQRGGGQRGQGQQGGQVVFRSDVQADLQLTDEQKTKLTEYRTSMRGNRQRGQGGGGGNGGGQGANREEMLARRAEQQKKLAEILTPEQVKRLKEIQIQMAGPQAVLDAEVQKELGLDAAQVKKIEDLQKTFREANQAVQQRVRSQEIDREKAAEARKTNNEALKTEITKILTAAQQEKLKTLGGKPFKADADRR
jgi:hypothetical protein